jgi:molybdopterin converting factor small subunit
MAELVFTPSPLSSYTNGRNRFTVPGSSVIEVVRNFCRQNTAAGRYLLAGEGQHFLPYIRVSVNGTSIRDLEGPLTPVREQDTILIVVASAGG